MQLHQALHQRQADAQATFAAVQTALALGERVEHARQQLGRDADAVVLDADQRVIALALQ